MRSRCQRDTRRFPGDAEAEVAARGQLAGAVGDHAERRAGLLQAPAHRAPRRGSAGHPPQRPRAAAAAAAGRRPRRSGTRLTGSARSPRLHTTPLRRRQQWRRGPNSCLALGREDRRQCHSEDDDRDAPAACAHGAWLAGQTQDRVSAGAIVLLLAPDAGGLA